MNNSYANFNSITKNNMANNISIPQNDSYEFIKGSDYYPNYYDADVTQKVYIRFYQLTLFNEKNKRYVRSYLLKGVTGLGDCCYKYDIMEVQNYKLSSSKVDEFVNFLTKNNNSKIKVKYKFYPAYNFDNILPPHGYEINECVSELLK